MSANSETRADRKYTREHEWARIDGDEVVIGITAFAVEQLGDITLVNFDLEAGDEMVAGEPFGTIESVKTLSDLFGPVNGTVTAVNENLEDAPETVNDDCWGEGWMVRIQLDDAGALDELMSPEKYESFLKDADD